MVAGRDADRDHLQQEGLEEAGVAATPKTWTELLAAARKLKAAGKIPFAVGNQTPWITQLIPYAIAPSTAFAEDPNLAQDMLDGKKTFSNSGWGSVFDRYLELYKDDLFNKSPNGTTFEQTQQLLGTGKAGMVVQVIAALPPFLAAAKDKSDLATFPFPAVRRSGHAEDPGRRRGRDRRQRERQAPRRGEEVHHLARRARADGDLLDRRRSRSRSWAPTRATSIRCSSPSRPS